MDAPARTRPITRSAALFALAALVSLSVAVPGGAQAQMVGGQTAAASQFIARLNEVARTLAGAKAEADVKPCRAARSSATGSDQVVAAPTHPPAGRGALSLGHRLDLARLYLPPPAWL